MNIFRSRKDKLYWICVCGKKVRVPVSFRWSQDGPLESKYPGDSDAPPIIAEPNLDGTWKHYEKKHSGLK